MSLSIHYTSGWKLDMVFKLKHSTVVSFWFFSVIQRKSHWAIVLLTKSQHEHMWAYANIPKASKIDDILSQDVIQSVANHRSESVDDLVLHIEYDF